MNSNKLATLQKQIENEQRAKESITAEIAQKSFTSLNENLTKNFKEKLDFTMKYIKDNTDNAPARYKRTAMLWSFTSGILLAMILSVFAWIMWIKPYQVSPSRTIENNQGEKYLLIEQSELHKYSDKQVAVRVY